MFEQELYNYEVSDVRLQPGDLFYNYEVKNWNFTPRLYKILGISAVLNIVALVVIGSSGMLTTRGCESPFVGRVCQVLDTVYVGSIIFGTESEYADVDYTKSELEDAEVTFVDVTGVSPPLTYPAGYFQLANPEQQFVNETMPPITPSYTAPGFPTNPTLPGGGLINTPPISPNANPNAVQGTLPTDGPLGNVNDNPTIPGNRKGRRGGKVSDATADANTNPIDANANTANPTATAANPDEAQEDKFGFFINKRPIKDRAKESLEKIEKEGIKIDTPFKVVISGTLGPGKDSKVIILKNPKPVPNDPPYKNDPAMEKFVQDWILAVGDTGWFAYLDKLKSKKVIITVEQNDTEFFANIKADQPTENDARMAASGINAWLQLGALGASGDELMFLQKGSATNAGKAFVLNFKIEKPIVQEMIMRKLAESKDKEPKPEGNALGKQNNNTAER